jgi:hypothetical protein
MVSSGGSFESRPFFFRGLDLGESPAGAPPLSSCICFTVTSRVATRARMRSRSSRISIFSFIATSYFRCSSLSVGSKDV